MVKPQNNNKNWISLQTIFHNLCLFIAIMSSTLKICIFISSSGGPIWIILIYNVFAKKVKTIL